MRLRKGAGLAKMILAAVSIPSNDELLPCGTFLCYPSPRAEASWAVPLAGFKMDFFSLDTGELDRLVLRPPCVALRLAWKAFSPPGFKLELWF